MTLELAVQATDPIVQIAGAVALVLAAWLGRGQHDRWRNNRRGNPGPNANDYRYTGKRGSNCKPGLGTVCVEHGKTIAAQGGAIERLGAYQETFEKNQDAIQAQLATIQEAVTTLVERVGD